LFIIFNREILLRRKELLKEKFITEILKKPELLLDIKNIELSDEYEKQFQDFLSINDINWYIFYYCYFLIYK